MNKSLVAICLERDSNEAGDVAVDDGLLGHRRGDQTSSHARREVSGAAVGI